MQEHLQILKNRINVWIVSMLLFAVSIVLAGIFSERISAQETGSIELTFPLEGVTYSLYRIGSYSEGGYALDDRYASYNVDIFDTDAAVTLETYIRRDALQPDQTGVTDTAGKVKFENLSLGAYLLIGEAKDDGEYIYTPFAGMVSVPSQEEDEVVYDLQIQAKYGISKRKTPGKITVLKVWKNDSESDRPEEITVQLLEDGMLTEEVDDSEVVLSKENNWTYSWQISDTSLNWTVAEKDVPSGYKVNIEKNSENTETTATITAVITNTKSGSSKPPSPSNPSGSRIPQTGQLWWPVGILAAAGLFLILIGLLIRKRRD